MSKLPKINDKRIEEIENGAMDDGRFFVHLNSEVKVAMIS